MDVPKPPAVAHRFARPVRQKWHEPQNTEGITPTRSPCVNPATSGATVTTPGGRTLVTNAGSNGKFLAVLDLDIAKGKVATARYRLLPVFSELLKPDPAMQALIDKMRAPYAAALDEKIAAADRLL